MRDNIRSVIVAFVSMCCFSLPHLSLVSASEPTDEFCRNQCEAIVAKGRQDLLAIGVSVTTQAEKQIKQCKKFLKSDSLSIALDIPENRTRMNPTLSKPDAKTKNLASHVAEKRDRLNRCFTRLED